MTDIIKNILNLARERNINEQSINNILHSDKNIISDWKLGKSEPTACEALTLAYYFNVSCDCLLTGKVSEIKKDSFLSKDEVSLLNDFNQLNNMAKGRIIGYVQGLIDDSENKVTGAVKRA